jgi:hypothetical protein
LVPGGDFPDNLGIHCTDQTPQNGFEEIEEQFYEGTENRLRILDSLAKKGLPVDVSRKFPFVTNFISSATHHKIHSHPLR